MIQVINAELAIVLAVEAARRADVIILYVRLTREFESEGFDRPNIDLLSSLPPLIIAVIR